MRSISVIRSIVGAAAIVGLMSSHARAQQPSAPRQTTTISLDEVISRLSLDFQTDQLQLKRLKKRKLILKDQITRLESELIPDLNA